MAATLTYGTGLTCTIGCEVSVTRPAEAPSLSAAEVVKRLGAALAHPLDYPPLPSAIVPGDRVVIVLDRQTPDAELLVAGALSGLRNAGVEPSHVTLLTSTEFPAKELLHSEFGQLGSDEIGYEIHDPDDQRRCTFLGVLESGRALRLNQTLCEADLVLPIGASWMPFRPGETGAKFGPLLSEFGDRETIERFHAPTGLDSPVQRAKRCVEADEALWRLGIGLAVLVVPSPAGGIAEIFAGEPAAICKSAEPRCRAIWSTQVARRGDLVIVTMPGERGEQSWRNLGRCVQAAQRLVEDSGAIAVCSELEEPPGRSLQRLADADFATVEHEVMRDRSPDSWPALVLSRALSRGPVYLRSCLADEIVEHLGMTPIADDEELSRLADTHQHCIVLHHGQRLVPTVAQGH